MVDVVRKWCFDNNLLPRDVQVLVPLARHVALAKDAWVQEGGWMPRFETIQTLAAALRPPERPLPQQVSFDVAMDRLSAAHLLAPVIGGSSQGMLDAGGRAWAAVEVTATAHSLARAAFAVPPAQRGEYWARARALIRAAFAPESPGQIERLLAMVALEWAALAPAPATDALFEHRSQGWVLMEAGGADALALAVVSQAQSRGEPVLLIKTDVRDDGAAGLQGAVWRLHHRACADFETEAQCAAAQVMSHVQAGEVPVALVAQDRLLVRRVRALLARHHLPIIDETGWTLSTTRAAALVMAAVSLCRSGLAADDFLDALKSCVSPLGQPNALLSEPAMCALESAWRRHGWRCAEVIDSSRLPDAAAKLVQHVFAQAGPVQVSRPRTLAQWQQVLTQLLKGLGVFEALQNDEAGRQVLQRLFPSEGWPQVEGNHLDWETFTGLLDDLFEQTSFVPTAAPSAQVVITPLMNLPLRPFAAVVFPGCDEVNLGAWPQDQQLLKQSIASSLGMRSPRQHRHVQWVAFCQVLRVPRVTLLCRETQQGESLAMSPFLVTLSAISQSDPPFQPAPENRVECTVRAEPAVRPLPVAPDHLPTRLTASSCEALRQCPYRFFALHMLQLRADEELDEEIAKRDYGTWLHEVLFRFHQRRAESGISSAQVEADQLSKIAQEVQQSHGLDRPEFLPYAATFRRFVSRYIEWLHRRDASGAHWLDGERALSAEPAAWQGMAMVGVIDRVDRENREGGAVTQLIDYKTSSSAALRQKVKRPLEDTQLAFYAALMAAQPQDVGPISAAYVTLDDSDAIETLVHPDVETSAEMLIQGIAHDLTRLRQGAPLQALGEGTVCGTCEARGLCRRDQWSVTCEVDE